jgi:hypothetical protein
MRVKGSIGLRYSQLKKSGFFESGPILFANCSANVRKFAFSVYSEESYGQTNDPAASRALFRCREAHLSIRRQKPAWAAPSFANCHVYARNETKIICASLSE